MKIIFETKRLILRQFTENDFAFILELVNSEEWLKFIGDKNIKTDEQAKEYLLNGPVKSYKNNGFGLSMVELKNGKVPIGMCGIINRETLEHPDIGFAFLPNHTNKGFGFEIASKTLEYATNYIGIKHVLAITVPENIASIKLLEKIGMNYQKRFKFPNDDTELMLFSN